MTIIESVKNYLLEIADDIIALMEIDSLRPDVAESKTEMMTGLFANQNDIEETYINGDYRRTEYKTLYARQASALDSQRISNQVWYETLRYRVRQNVFDGVLPTLDNDRVCEDINVDSGLYISENIAGVSVYQIRIRIVYKGSL